MKTLLITLVLLLTFAVCFLVVYESRLQNNRTQNLLYLQSRENEKAKAAENYPMRDTSGVWTSDGTKMYTLGDSTYTVYTVDERFVLSTLIHTEVFPL